MHRLLELGLGLGLGLGLELWLGFELDDNIKQVGEFSHLIPLTLTLTPSALIFARMLSHEKPRESPRL